MRKTKRPRIKPTADEVRPFDLVHALRHCIEYVVTHELCHVEHRDDDTRFCKLPGQVMPESEQRKQRLRRGAAV